MLNSLSLRQQHFLHQRKNLYTKNLYEVFQARQNQRILTKILRLLSPFSLPIHPRTLSELVWRRSGWDGDRGIIKEGRRETRDIKTFGRGTSGGIYGNTQGFIRLRYGAKVHCLSVSELCCFAGRF